MSGAANSRCARLGLAGVLAGPSESCDWLAYPPLTIFLDRDACFPLYLLWTTAAFVGKGRGSTKGEYRVQSADTDMAVVVSFFIWSYGARATSSYGAEKPVLPPNAFFQFSAFLLPSSNMCGWLGFDPMMRSCFTGVTCRTAIVPAPGGYRYILMLRLVEVALLSTRPLPFDGTLSLQVTISLIAAVTLVSLVHSIRSFTQSIRSLNPLVHSIHSFTQSTRLLPHWISCHPLVEDGVHSTLVGDGPGRRGPYWPGHSPSSGIQRRSID